METIKKGELAKRLGVSAARISQLVAEGLPVLADGKLDYQASLAWIAQHVDRAGSGWLARKAVGQVDAPRKPRAAADPVPQPAGSDLPTMLLRARTIKLIADGQRAQRLEKVAAGELVAKADVEATALDVHRQVRDACQTIPARCCGVIMAEVRRAIEAAMVPEVAASIIAGLSPAEAERLFSVEIRKILDDLATKVERAAA
jgi:phage terminase Nu1 subunit (DNA packaging protein)